MPLAKNIKYLRKKNGMTQTDLAVKLGYKSQSTIQKWEQKMTFPPMEKVKEMSELFSCDLTSMFDDDLERKDIEIKDGIHLDSNELRSIIMFRALPPFTQDIIRTMIQAAYDYALSHNKPED